MLTVNLFDAAFRHNPGSSVHGKTAKHIRYVRDRMFWDGITMFTDAVLTETEIVDMVESRYKVGWLLEPREYRPHTYDRALAKLDKLDLLLTHDQGLIDARPDKVRFVPFGGCWIPQEQWGMHEKTENVCQIMSAKQFLPGHRLRHEIARRFPEVDCYGHGSASGGISYEQRADILARYKFAIVVENSRARNFFTEKLLDCFAVGTIPIYWGCQNIAYFFDPFGMIAFESNDLPRILASLDYDRHREAARANLETMRQYEITDDWIALNILEPKYGT